MIVSYPWGLGSYNSPQGIGLGLGQGQKKLKPIDSPVLCDSLFGSVWVNCFVNTSNLVGNLGDRSVFEGTLFVPEQQSFFLFTKYNDGVTFVFC